MEKTGLKRYIIRRVLQTIPLIFVIVIINFSIIHLAPGDPAEILAGPYASFEYIDFLRTKFGLNKPLHEQLLIYIWNLLHLDLGISLSTERPVLETIFSAVPATILLITISAFFSVTLGIFLGVIASKKVYSLIDNVLSFISLIGYSSPVFWLGLMFILVFGLYLNIFPISGMISLKAESTGISYVFDVLWHVFLPASTLAIAWLAMYFRMTRASMLEELRKDYIITAWAKGLDERTVFYKHALRNALLPVITVLGFHLGHMFAGSLLVETVFSWPGMGRLMYSAIILRDYPLIMGIFFIIALSVVIGNLITDISYHYLDPRIRYD